MAEMKEMSNEAAAWPANDEAEVGHVSAVVFTQPCPADQYSLAPHNEQTRANEVDDRFKSRKSVAGHQIIV
jgi:hypothetical protein